MDKKQDETLQILTSFRPKEPTGAAVQNIVREARANPRNTWKWLGALRQMRAFIYVPQTRYVIMASVVGFFIVVGLIGQQPPMTNLQEQQIAAIGDSMASNGYDTKVDMMLMGVTFDVEEPLDEFWLAEI